MIAEVAEEITKLNEPETDRDYIFRKFRNAKIDEIVVLCTNHKFEEARECANRFDNAYLPGEQEEFITTLLWQINDYERMLTGNYYQKDYDNGKVVKTIRKKDKSPTRKLRRAPKRKRGRQ